MILEYRTTLQDAITQYPSLLLFFAEKRIPFMTHGTQELGTVLEKNNYIFEQFLQDSTPYINTAIHFPFNIHCTLQKLTEDIYTHYHIPTRNLVQTITLLLKEQEEFSTENTLLLDFSLFFALFSEEMEKHLHKEETILFPMIIEFENTSELNYKQALACPIIKMKEEHALHAENSMQMLALNAQLRSSEKNNVQKLTSVIDTLLLLTLAHIHIENNILFHRIQEHNVVL